MLPTPIIEKGIPLPTPRNHGGVCHALRQMEIGDSMLAPLSYRNSLHNVAAKCGMKVSVRKTETGDAVRVWRVA